VWDCELDEVERCAEVDGESVIEFGEGDVEDGGDAFAVAGVGDEDVRAWLVVVGGDFGEETDDVFVFAHVDLVGRDGLVWWGSGAR